MFEVIICVILFLIICYLSRKQFEIRKINFVLREMVAYLNKPNKDLYKILDMTVEEYNVLVKSIKEEENIVKDIAKTKGERTEQINEILKNFNDDIKN